MTWANRFFIAILILAVLVRLAVMMPRVGRLVDDPDKYLPLARSLAAGTGFSIRGRPTAYRPPLYPIILAPIVGGDGTRFSAGIAALHLLLGAGTVAFSALAARRWGLSPGRILIVAALVALDPVLVVQSRSVMTETLAAFLLAGALAASATGTLRGAGHAGVWFGLAALARPSTLPAAGLAALFAATTGSGEWRERILRGLALASLVAAVLAPWAIRNAIALGEPVWTTTHGGYTLALANNSAYYRDVLDRPSGTVWSGPSQRAWFVRISQETDGMSEPDADRHLRAGAFQLARDQPWRFARASIARLGRLWGLAPSGSVYGLGPRVVTALWTAPFWIAVALGLAQPVAWRWPRAAALAIVMSLTVVHAFYWTDLRMRAPLVPALALMAASASLGDRKKFGEKSEN